MWRGVALDGTSGVSRGVRSVGHELPPDPTVGWAGCRAGSAAPSDPAGRFRNLWRGVQRVAAQLGPPPPASRRGARRHGRGSTLSKGEGWSFRGSKLPKMGVFVDHGGETR